MNSIAYMDRPKPTAESAALDGAMKRQGVQNASLARHMNVSDGLVSQWRRGRRPVPAVYAPKVARFLEIDDPRLISAQYAEVQQAQIGNGVPVPSAPESPDDLAVRRLENAVDALRYGMAAITSVMVSHRPAEARDVARAIRKHVPPKVARTGFLAELLRALDKAS